MAEHWATAEGENCTYGPTLADTHVYISLLNAPMNSLYVHTLALMYINEIMLQKVS